MEKIEVTARFNPEGEITPLEFNPGSGSIRVHAVGRSWKTEEGFHILVLDLQSRAHHLLFTPVEVTWYRIQDLNPPPTPV